MPSEILRRFVSPCKTGSSFQISTVEIQHVRTWLELKSHHVAIFDSHIPALVEFITPEAAHWCDYLRKFPEFVSRTFRPSLEVRGDQETFAEYVERAKGVALSQDAARWNVVALVEVNACLFLLRYAPRTLSIYSFHSGKRRSSKRAIWIELQTRAFPYLADAFSQLLPSHRSQK